MGKFAINSSKRKEIERESDHVQSVGCLLLEFDKFLDRESLVIRTSGDKSVGITKVRVARAREIQWPVAAADFIRDRLLRVKLKAKEVVV